MHLKCQRKNLRVNTHTQTHHSTVAHAHKRNLEALGVTFWFNALFSLPYTRFYYDFSLTVPFSHAI